MAEMAEVIGRTEDAKGYRDLGERIKDAFNEAYVSPDGRIEGDTQTGYLLALHMGLLPEELRSVAAGHLVGAIEREDWHLSTGFAGVGYLCPVLTETGNAEVAYRLLNNDTYPSWGYTIKNGATTIWERWDGWTEENGFQSPNMNSFNHYSLGSVGEWLYRYVAGIDLASPGYGRILIRPRPGGGLTHARGYYDSVRGRISSSWKIEDDRFTLEVLVPPNTTATVHVPCADVSEGGGPVDEADGVEFLRSDKGETVLSVGSGRYEFAGRVEPA
jgi:alpha-L-rhamnosidase